MSDHDVDDSLIVVASVAVLVGAILLAVVLVGIYGSSEAAGRGSANARAAAHATSSATYGSTSDENSSNNQLLIEFIYMLRDEGTSYIRRHHPRASTTTPTAPPSHRPHPTPPPTSPRDSLLAGVENVLLLKEAVQVISCTLRLDGTFLVLTSEAGEQERR